jgi:N-acyl-phosphatidylethanolamine-hydrolysing phospholipase D
MENDRFLPFHKKGSRFINPHCDNARRRLHDVFLWQMGYYNDKCPPKKVPKKFKYPNSKKRMRKESPTATWINHCSFLIQVDGFHMLTDPIWSERCSPLSFLGPRRRHEPPIALKDLPTIDMVLISHDHYDHLDRKTVRALNERNPATLWVVPKEVGKWIAKQGVHHYVELSWWENASLEVDGAPPLSIEITAVPSQHFSGRGLFDKNKTLWAGYVVDFKRHRRKDKRLYFVGDTGYNSKDFKAIGNRFGEMDLSLIPIGTYVPAKFMDPVHISPQKATAIHQEVNSKLSIGMHWKTFRLSSEELHQPPYDLHRSLEKARVDPATFRVIDPGQKINW